MNQIYLIGFMGVGKSTVANYLKETYGYRVVEMDQCIEEEEGMSIAKIFACRGETYFRELETTLLRSLAKQDAAVISCGGGVVLRDENIQLMKRSGRVVLLTASPETILERVRREDQRPLLTGKKSVEDIAQMMEMRRAQYEAAADDVICVDGKTSAQVGECIMKKFRTKEKRIVLASASPRRREIMEQAGYVFEIKVSHREECYHSIKPAEIVEELALQKARDVAEQLEKTNVIVIGADTVVAYEDRVLGKPKSEAEAYQMLSMLQGHAHQVYTGVAILSYDSDGREVLHHAAVQTTVYVDSMEPSEIQSYLDTGEYRDKAGSYAIQGKFAPYIEKIEGDYYNVVGLPISWIRKVLKEVQ